MPPETRLNHEALTKRVQTSLRQAEAVTANLRKTNRRLLVAGILGSAGSTLVAGVTAAVGPLIREGIPGWRTACIIAAVFAFISALATGLNQQLRFSQRLSKGMSCIGRLRSLDMKIATGNKMWAEIAGEYEEIIRSFPEFAG